MQIIGEITEGSAGTITGAISRSVTLGDAAVEHIRNVPVSAESLPAGSSATAEWQDGYHLHFGIPKGEDGNSCVYIRYSAVQPTQDSDMKTTPDAWMGVYSGIATTAPTHYTDYTWYKIKGDDTVTAVTPEMYGAKADGTTDDYNAIVAAFNEAYTKNCAIAFPLNSAYKISTPLVIENVPPYVIMRGYISYSGSGTAITFGATSKQTLNKYLQVSAVGNETASSIGVKFINIAYSEIRIDKVRVFETGVLFDANSPDGDNYCTAYNNVSINDIGGCKVGLKLYSHGVSGSSAKGWANENKFWGGSIYPYSNQSWKADSIGVYITSDGYVSNNNVFYSITLEELNTAVKIDNGYSNCFYNVRTENVTGNCLLVDDNSANNIMTAHYGIGSGNSKAGNASKSFNLYTGPSDVISDYYTVPLFDSGSMSDGFAGNASNACVKKCCDVKKNITYSYGDISKTQTGTISVSGNIPIGGIVKTDNNKTVLLQHDISNNTQSSGQVILYIRMWDASGSAISSDDYKPRMISAGNVTYYSLSRYYYTAYSVYCYRIQGSVSKKTFITVPDNCVRAWIGLAPASGESFEINSILIYGRNYDSEVITPNTDAAVLSAIPTNAAPNNTFVRNSTSANGGWVYDGTSWVPSVPVQDVQVNGVSVLDAQGVANVPKAGGSNFGVVKPIDNCFTYYGDALQLKLPDDSDLKAGNNGWKALMPVHQHKSTFYGFAKAAGDTTQSASSNAVGNYTDNAKDKIQQMLGIIDMIAPHEGAQASQAYSIGKAFVYAGKLYKATAAIASGDAIVPNTNCTQTTLAEMIGG